MGQAQTTSTPKLTIKLAGSTKMLQQFKGEQEFKTVLEALLTAAGFTGEFNAYVDSRMKGTAHTKGFKLGNLVAHRRSVEFRWQPGGNDTRFCVHVSAPNGMEPLHFRRLLDEAQLQSLGAATQPTTLTEAVKEAPQPQDALSDVEIELFFREILPSATEAGTVVRQQCLEILEVLGRQDGEADLAALVAAEHLGKGATDAFLRISQKQLAQLRAVPNSTPNPEPKENEVPPANNLLSEAERLSRVVADAQLHRQRLPELQREVTELEMSIETAQRRLAEIKPQLEETKVFLANPVVEEAEQTLTTLRDLLKQ